jgi:hypothetical protein
MRGRDDGAQSRPHLAARTSGKWMLIEQRTRFADVANNVIRGVPPATVA